MIVPQFWAESRVQSRERGRQVTVRRFGWSDTSQAEAQANADSRAKEALERLLRGEKLLRSEPKVPYNGAAGVPIREEVISRHGENVITRNSYGARCLNTPNVLFADIDFSDQRSMPLSFAVTSLLSLCVGVYLWMHGSKGVGLAVILLGTLLGGVISEIARRISSKIQGGPERVARSRIGRFIEQHPDWALRVYKTPAGFRVVVTHATFSPSDPAVTEFFGALGTDRMYATMCRNQQCFRARLSAKPWRIGIASHLKPRPGVWPVAPERLPLRNAWVADYEKAAAGYAACAFTESLGSGAEHAGVRPVVLLHDQLSGATSQMPIA